MKYTVGEICDKIDTLESLSMTLRGASEKEEKEEREEAADLLEEYAVFLRCAKVDI